ncbi:MAG: hypothetical protein JNL21_31725 [Myxococcales bacterium]|nr:hypothetical protein [Myxococcales bacterium]
MRFCANVSGLAIAVCSIACDKPARENERPASSSGPRPTVTETSAASAPPAPQAASAAASPLPQPKVEVPVMSRTPAWLANPPQPSGAASLMARAADGPLTANVICRVEAPGSDWDQTAPFVGSPADGFADIVVTIGSTVARLSPNTPSGTVIITQVDWAKEGPTKVGVFDEDPTDRDTAFTRDVAVERLPLDIKEAHATLFCRGLPQEVVDGEIRARQDALDKALLAMEAAASKDASTTGRTEPPTLAAARGAAIALAAWIDPTDERLAEPIARIEKVDAERRGRVKAALDAKIDAAGARDAYRTLPSAKVRCHPTERLTLELEVGSRPLTRNWAARTLGPLGYLLVDETGSTYEPTFDHFFLDGKEQSSLDLKVPAGTKLTVTLGIGTSPPPYAIIAREGGRDAYLCRQ